jgi:hypothetical protein
MFSFLYKSRENNGKTVPLFSTCLIFLFFMYENLENVGISATIEAREQTSTDLEFSES